MNPASGVRHRAWIVWLILAGLIGVVVVIESGNRSRMPEDVAENVHGVAGSRLLLPVAVTALAAIELGYAGTLHRFERDANQVWFYHGIHTGPQQAHGHQSDPVRAEIIEKALAALGRTRVERILELDVKAQSYGLTSPQMIILLHVNGNPLPLAQFAVGDVAPDGLSRYVLKVGGASVVTIANYQIENLVGLIERLNTRPPDGAAAKP